MAEPDAADSEVAARVDLLVRALSDPHVSVGWNASRELAKLGSSASGALPELSKALRSHDANKALWARFAVAKITNEVPKHLSAFIDALTDKRVFPGMAAFALAGLGPDAANAVPNLIPLLADGNAENRWTAAGALAAIGSKSAAAVPDLIVALNDVDEKVRWYAAWALGEIGPAAAAAVPSLILALDDIDDDVIGYAARALGGIGGIQAIPALEELLDADNDAVRDAASSALACIRAPGE